MHITTFLNLPQVTIWIIEEPPVDRRETEIAKIVFRPGDKVTLRAGGCCQTGGAGSTWKRYVDPSGDNSEQLYHVFRQFRSNPILEPLGSAQ